MRDIRASVAMLALIGAASALAADASGPDLIFPAIDRFQVLTRTTSWRPTGSTIPSVEGVACYYTMHEKGGRHRRARPGRNTSDVSLSCRQYGPVKFREILPGRSGVQREALVVFQAHAIVRGCDVKRNVMVYMVYSDKLVEGSPENSTRRSRWNHGAREPNQCKGFLK